jgi:SAM-dependent methyltransferase
MQLSWRREYPAPTCFKPYRVPAPEYLDSTDLSRIHRALSYIDLERLDRLPWQFEPLWTTCRKLIEKGFKSALEQPFELLELGAGTGHTGRRIVEHARRQGFNVRVHLTDRETGFMDMAGLAMIGITRVSCLDWLSDPLPSSDITYANLVLHHFQPDHAVLALAKMHRASRLGGVIYDLNRHRAAFHALKWMFPLWAKSPMTVADALISVQQAFTAAELGHLARQAGIRGACVETHGLFRNLLWWERS